MYLKMLFECRLSNLLFKTYPTEESLKLLPEHNHDTRSKALKTIQANDNRGGRFLLYTGVKLYSRYLLEDWTGSGNIPMSGLAERLRVYAQLRSHVQTRAPTYRLVWVFLMGDHRDSRHSSLRTIRLSTCFSFIYITN